MTAKYTFLDEFLLGHNSYNDLSFDGLLPNIKPRTRFDLSKIFAAAALNNIMSLTLNWQRCTDTATGQSVWGNLWDIDLNHFHFDSMYGVYIIWYYADFFRPVTVRVGQGFVKDRLISYRNDNRFLALNNRYLFATWASVDFSQQNGVENYLGNTLKPLIADRFPDALPIKVNLPW